MVDQARRTYPAVVERARFTERESGPIMDVQDVGWIVGLDFNKGGNGAIVDVARAEIDSKNLLAESVGQRTSRMMRHPWIVVVGLEDVPLLFPQHGQNRAIRKKAHAVDRYESSPALP